MSGERLQDYWSSGYFLSLQCNEYGFLSKIPQELIDLEFWNLEQTLDMASCTCIKDSATYCLSVLLFVYFPFFPVKVVWPLMATAGVM